MKHKRKKNPEKKYETGSPWPWIFGATAVVGVIYFLGESEYSPLA